MVVVQEATKKGGVQSKDAGDGRLERWKAVGKFWRQFNEWSSIYNKRIWVRAVVVLVISINLPVVK